MAGGNPRILTLTYRFLEITDTHTTMEDLERLLDDVTPYYKARVEEYHTTLQRAIIDAIALHWDPITTKILANVMGEKSTTLSAQLSRLQKDGMIEKVETSGSYAGYQLSERFLNIWYLMRHGTRRNKQKLRWLTAFLSTFYSRNDLDDIHKQAKATGMVERWSKDFALAFEQAQKDSYSVTSNNDIEFETELEEARLMHKEAFSFYKAADYNATLECLEAIISRFGGSGELALQKEVADAMFSKAFTLGQSGNTSAALESYDAVIFHFADKREPVLEEQVARAMFNKATILEQDGEKSAELESYETLIARFVDSEIPTIQVPVAIAMFNKACSLRQNGEKSAELDAYETLITQFEESEILAVQDLVAKTMFNKAATLGQSGDLSSALAGYDSIVTRFETSKDLRIQEEVVKAMSNKAATLAQWGDTSSSLEAFDDVIVSFADSDEPVIQTQIAISLFNKAFTLRNLGNIEAAIKAYEQSLDLWNKIDVENSEPLKSNIEIKLANLLFDYNFNLQRAEALYRQALKQDPACANSNLFWLYLANDKLEDAKHTYDLLNDVSQVGRCLMDAALAFDAENFGQGTEHLHKALSEGLSQEGMTFDDDAERLIRVALSRDFGERLIEWFQTTRFADRYAPLFVALVAAVKGEEHLLDTNPEVRDAAQVIYQRLVAGCGKSEKGS
ncbi:tetratricopeptide repeat protein [Cohaesibacter gelatinilyticus]|uniref:tetratricopeptide repeat protein n=1 Tax=Cohaesibacter gelatinilyticus TaxID=372072 RepID=UPI001FCE3BE2|nr:tetratricopeptide repeat protein [Cohaesibacter gelatinilyticus]